MKTRLEYLDYSRFFAIIGVILVHASQYSKTSLFIGDSLAGLGRFGVQLFFIVSGATIYLSHNGLIKKANFPIMSFYIKRFFRIVPLFVVMGIYYSFSTNFSLVQILSPLSGLDPRYLNVIAGGWSIWDEMYFYLLFPTYLIFRKTNLSTFVFSLILLILTNLIHFRIYDFGTVNEMSDFDYLNIFNQFICFVFGIELMAKKLDRLLIFFFTYLIFGFFMKFIYFREYIFVSDYGSSYFLALISLMCVCFVSFLKIVTKKYSNINNSLIAKLLASIGKMTYTSYMIHFIIIDCIKKSDIDFGTEINFVLISITTFALSYFLKPYTENLFADLGYKISKKYTVAD
jgi:peptidoglycan/LPS O-acetylase OafA/YrhL